MELSEIESGGPPKDGIPAIDKPRFAAIPVARAWLKPKEPAIVLRLGAKARAYPIQVLMFHEIVNDRFERIPVAVTFCPLCNASVIFDRRVENAVLDFGTTGRLPSRTSSCMTARPSRGGSNSLAKESSGATRGPS